MEFFAAHSIRYSNSPLPFFLLTFFFPVALVYLILSAVSIAVAAINIEAINIP